ncbi:MAG: hypothetical protein ACE5K2_02060 [Candidatus Zixiibacteriota bacterium]
MGIDKMDLKVGTDRQENKPNAVTRLAKKRDFFTRIVYFRNLRDVKYIKARVEDPEEP